MKNNRAGETNVGVPLTTYPTSQQNGANSNGNPMVLRAKKQPIKNAFNTPFGNNSTNMNNDSSSYNDDDIKQNNNGTNFSYNMENEGHNGGYHGQKNN